LLKVQTYRNKSQHFDVFDIDGDGKPEIMGVQYYYAYTLKNKKPFKLRAAPERDSFYRWLYRNGYTIKDGKIIFNKATVSKFVGKRAVKGKTYKKIRLYEAYYTEESIQFFKPKCIDFVRELRRISSTYKLNSKILGINLH
jgi:hypothetical protein